MQSERGIELRILKVPGTFIWFGTFIWLEPLFGATRRRQRIVQPHAGRLCSHRDQRTNNAGALHRQSSRREGKLSYRNKERQGKLLATARAVRRVQEQMGHDRGRVVSRYDTQQKNCRGSAASSTRFP